MVAPTGVNEGLPQRTGEGRAGRGGARGAAGGRGGTGGNGAEPKPNRRQAEAGQQGGASRGGASRGGAPAGRARSCRANGRPAEAEVSGLAEAEPELGEPDPAEAGLPRQSWPRQGCEPGAGAEPVEAEPVEAGEPTGADWDAEESRRDVSPLAVAGIILGVIALVGVAVGVLAVVTHGFRPKTVVTYRPAAVFGLRPGQCVNSGSDALKFTVLSCARPHDAEVFAAFSLPATAWPGASAVRVDAGNGCASRFDSYIDPQLAAASLTQEYVYPNQAAWQAGERTVVCEVSAANGQLTGSVRAKG